MLVIRREQMTVLKDRALAGFRTRLVSHLCEYLARSGKKNDLPVVEKHVDIVLERAPRFRMNRECDIARLSEIACLYLEPDRLAWESKGLIRILAEYDVNSEQRLALFEAWAARHA
jgi:hypothetical protein